MNNKLKMNKQNSLYVLFTIVLVLIIILCTCLGSASIPLRTTISSIIDALLGKDLSDNAISNIVISIRLPRVLNVALIGASLSLCGATMQGLLQNPLADGTTVGVSSGASLGAILVLALGIENTTLSYSVVMLSAMLFTFLSLVLILGLTYALDRNFSTNSVILIGIIFSMFISSISTLIITFSKENLRSITFWTMGSLSGTTYKQTLILAITLIICTATIISRSTELDALTLGEANARHIGVNVKRVKLILLITVSVLIGICVSISGTIGFVGLIIPHMVRMITGAKHKTLLPITLYLGAIFLLVADLISRTIISPIELPIGVITSIVGALTFVFIFYKSRRRRTQC